MNADEFIKHAIYDPVKAHEYYLKTRELKGKRSSSALKGQKKKEGWAYVQEQVRQKRKSELKGLSDSNTSNTKQLREEVKARREELTAKIKKLLEDVSSDVQRQIDAIPTGLSKEERSQKIAEIRAKGVAEKDSKRTSREADRAAMAEELRNSLDQAKASYSKKRESVKAKYETILDKEFQSIKNGSSR